MRPYLVLLLQEDFLHTVQSDTFYLLKRSNWAIDEALSGTTTTRRFLHTVQSDTFYLLKRSNWAIDEALSGTTTSGQSRLGTNGNEEVLYTSQIPRTGASVSDTVLGS